MSENQPREYDAVLGGNQAPVDGVVLGGIEGVKRRLANSDVKARVAGLYQALNYGDAGLDLIIKALRDNEKEVKKIAYSILKEREETRIVQKLEKYSKYQIFDCISTLEEHESKVNSVCIAPDRENIISGSEDSVIVWNWLKDEIKTNFVNKDKLSSGFGKVNLSSHYNESVSFVYFNYVRNTVYIRSSRVKIIEIHWNNSNYKNVLFGELNGSHHSLSCNKNGDILFIGNMGGTIKVWDIIHQKRKSLLRGHSKTIFSLAVYENTLFSGSRDKTIKIWDWQKEELIRTLEGHSSSVKALCISPDGKTLFSGSIDNTIKIWNWQKGELIRTLEGHSLGVNSLAISPDGKTLISASNDTTIKVWNWKSGKLQATLRGHSAEVNSIALSPNGKHLFSGSSDKTVKIWGLESLIK